MMKKITTTLLACVLPVAAMAQGGWPKAYDGVMMQAFYWDSYIDTQWKNIEAQVDDIAPYISLIWIPNSGNCATSGNVMGYTPVYWYNHNSSFGSEEALRSMIKTYKERGTGFLLDAVINHRNGAGSWMGFPAELNPDDGLTHQMTAADVCSTDEVNSDASAGAEYGTATGAADTGDDFNGSRDLDHTSEHVQSEIIAYLKYCRENIGFTGFRYDMVKGYAGQYTKLYNESVFGSDQIYSVGEYWDGSASNVGSWLTACGKKSAAFDFPLKYSINSAFNYCYWADNLSSASSGLYRSTLNKQYAVTFAENHDTNYEQNSSSNALKKDTLAANAFILGIPGTPCVFLTHWKAYSSELKEMIMARKAAGITNTSSFTQKEAVNGTSGHYAWTTGNLFGVIGMCEDFATPAGYTLILDGAANHYRYYLSSNLEMPWCTQPTRTFEKPIVAKLIAVSTSADAKIVYTLDGSEPTASSTSVESGYALNVTETTTLKYGMLKDGVVSGVETRTYTYTPFQEHTATIYVSNELPNTWEAGYVNYHVWDSNQNRLTTNDWPGDKESDTVELGGKKWYHRSFDITSSTYYVNIVISTASGSPQTVDFTNITNDVYLEVSPTMNNEKYNVNDVTDQYSSISQITIDNPSVEKDVVYDLQGRRVSEVKAGQLYIRDGRKFMVK